MMRLIGRIAMDAPALAHDAPIATHLAQAQQTQAQALDHDAAPATVTTTPRRQPSERRRAGNLSERRRAGNRQSDVHD
jgi:hypothetical protein